jgi:hypothetical protein
MNSITKIIVTRGAERRAGDRRNANLPIAGKDRRAGERRSGSERRA